MHKISLFSEVVKINPHTILLTNNNTDLAALTKIYEYWVQFLRGVKNNIQNVSADKDAGVRKFQIAIQIQNGDEDFIVSSLKPLGLCPEKNTFRC